MNPDATDPSSGQNKKAIVGCVLILLVLGTSCLGWIGYRVWYDSDAQRHGRTLEEAKQAEAAGDLDKAARAYSYLDDTAHHEEARQALFRLLDTAIASDDRDAVSKILEHVDSYSFPEVRAERAGALCAMAIRLCRKDPREGYFLLDKIKRGQQNPAARKQVLEALVAKEPDRWEDQAVELALGYEQAGDIPRCRELLEPHLKNNIWGEGARLLGVALVRAGELERGTELYERGLESRFAALETAGDQFSGVLAELGAPRALLQAAKEPDPELREQKMKAVIERATQTPRYKEVSRQLDAAVLEVVDKAMELGFACIELAKTEEHRRAALSRAERALEAIVDSGKDQAQTDEIVLALVGVQLDRGGTRRAIERSLDYAQKAKDTPLALSNCARLFADKAPDKSRDQLLELIRGGLPPAELKRFEALHAEAAEPTPAVAKQPAEPKSPKAVEPTAEAPKADDPVPEPSSPKAAAPSWEELTQALWDFKSHPAAAKAFITRMQADSQPALAALEAALRTSKNAPPGVQDVFDALATLPEGSKPGALRHLATVRGPEFHPTVRNASLLVFAALPPKDERFHPPVEAAVEAVMAWGPADITEAAEAWLVKPQRMAATIAALAGVLERDLAASGRIGSRHLRAIYEVFGGGVPAQSATAVLRAPRSSPFSDRAVRQLAELVGDRGRDDLPGLIALLEPFAQDAKREAKTRQTVEKAMEQLRKRAEGK